MTAVNVPIRRQSGTETIVQKLWKIGQTIINLTRPITDGDIPLQLVKETDIS